MSPNRDAVLNLMDAKKWNASELARRMGISRSEVHRFLYGKRDGGKKFISGLLNAFPDESLNALFNVSDRQSETSDTPIIRDGQKPGN